MTMYGEIDSIVSHSDPRRLRPLGAPKRLVEIVDAGHYAFSDSCFPAPEAIRR